MKIEGCSHKHCGEVSAVTGFSDNRHGALSGELWLWVSTKLPILKPPRSLLRLEIC